MQKIYLGLPKGFCRIQTNRTKIAIYETIEQKDNIEPGNWNYDMFNIPVWKYGEVDSSTANCGCPVTEYQ